MAYFGGGSPSTVDIYARQRAATLDTQVRELAKRVAELEAALKARDDADDTALELAGRWT